MLYMYALPEYLQISEEYYQIVQITNVTADLLYVIIFVIVMSQVNLKLG